jgi:hypothetical protein
MANALKMLLYLGVYADDKHFPKNSSFFQFHLTKRMIETAQLTMFYVF